MTIIAPRIDVIIQIGLTRGDRVNTLIRAFTLDPPRLFRGGDRRRLA
jgi:hypothetical protein